ncbi:hypothetical protein [Paenibacillus tarimensis]|uniref:hypothetical protein n=1 Tax=Paenibacillus tarimensis TaxID=416012 RepID=UPI001F317F53|nr:hypothetical protein [Paenibacillus tarimensis]MCF2946480.1 hypothetical protein [Paenibacillus tarimensis]
MSLTRKEAEELFKLGFKRPSYADEVYPQDIYEYDDSIWVVGGRVIPKSTLLSDAVIYKEGTWIPALDDMLSWLEDNDYLFELCYIGNGYKIKVVDTEGNEYKAKGSTPLFVCYKVILKLLETLNGKLRVKHYHVDEVELIERKDLR